MGGSIKTMPDNNKWYLQTLPKYTVPTEVFNTITDAGLFEIAKKEVVKKKMYSGGKRKCMEDEVWMVARREAEAEQNMDSQTEVLNIDEQETPIIQYEENDQRNLTMVAFKDDFDNWRIGCVVGEGNMSFKVCIYTACTANLWKETNFQEICLKSEIKKTFKLTRGGRLPRDVTSFIMKA